MVKLQVLKPRAILFDISGTVVKSSFIDKVLMPYIKEYIRTYLVENAGQSNVLSDIENLRNQASTEPDSPQIPKEGDSAILLESIIRYVTFCVDNKKESKALVIFRFHMWFDGFRRQRIETPVYSDVAIQMQKWRNQLGIKQYVFSNGWAEATKRFLTCTNHGDLNLLLDGYYDTSFGSLTDAATFDKVIAQIKEPHNQVLFLTKSSDEGRAAFQAGLIVVLVLTHRRNIEKLDEEARRMPLVRSFNEIEFVEEDSAIAH